MKKILALAALGAAFFAAPASANITFIDNPGDLCGPAGLGGGCEENIMFEKQAESPALTLTGDTNQTGQPISFDTTFAAGVSKPGGSPNLGGPGTNQLIAADGLGQANIQACKDLTHCGPSGPNGVQLTSLEMKPANGTAWHDVLINLDSGEGTANIWVADDLGNNFDDTLGPGQGFLGILASAGEVITDIQISQQVGTQGPFGWNDFKQPRVSGTCTLVGTTCTLIATPEPASLGLLGAALAVFGLMRRRKSV